MKQTETLDFAAAKEKALRLLEFRSHSEQELRIKLRRAGAMDEDIDRILDFLREYSLVNDRLYAERLAADLSHLKKYGGYRIKAELLRRGISGEICDEVIASLDCDEAQMLLPLMEKKLGGDFDRKSRDRAFRYFASRGYSFDDIKHAFEQISAQSEYEGEE